MSRPPLEFLTGEIKRALSSNLYYLSIVGTLQLPDVCAALESQDGETRRSRYEAWVTRWFLPSYQWITATDLYSMRCGVIHQGRFGHTNMSYSRVLFTLPNSHNIILHNNVFDDALNLDAVIFCHDMMAAVDQWWVTNEGSDVVQKNLARLMTLHPNGLSPYIVGVPIIS